MATEINLPHKTSNLKRTKRLKLKRFSLHTLLAAIVIGLLALCAEPALAKKRTKRSRRARTEVKKKRTKRSRGARVRRNRRPAPVKPLIIRGTDGIIAAADTFVAFQRPVSITGGLEGRVIALWPSHGLYFNTSGNNWAYQRPNLFTTREDLLSHTFATAYLTPMLENAGAYVMMPRERDWSHVEIIADYDGMDRGEYAVTNGREDWEELEDSTGYAWPGRPLTPADNPFRAGTADIAATVLPKDARNASTASWNVDLPEKGNYAVYVSYASLPNSATDARYTINHLGGSTKVKVNQQMGGGTWIYLGSYDFAKGMQKDPVVELSNISADEGSVVSADAVKVGGGMGSVSRSSYSSDFTSGVPKFNEGSAVYLQTAGMPRHVWQPNNGESDYKDDYMSRAHWANYLAGGSPIFPDTTGLGIPVDMVFAFHTDAGIKRDSTTVGTLGLYSTDDGNPFGNGSARSANADLTRNVTSSVISDIRALYDPMWNSRGSRDRKYFEVRETKMPGMIIEALSHQNFEDMRRALDPEFKFILSRAVYKGILRFLAERYGTTWAVQPLPAKDFAINYLSPGHYRLSWAPQPDKLEPSAFPTYYIIEERIDNGGFRPLATVRTTHYDVEINDDAIHSYRIKAGNDGGVTFPSETLALYDHNHTAPEVTIVNGFTRVAAPGVSDTGAGFDIEKYPPIAAGFDIGTTGPQYDFAEMSEYSSNYNPGWGASHGNFESRVLAGNTFDFVIEHGQGIKKAGHGFISTSASAYAESQPSAADPKVVDLMLGLQKTDVRPGSGEVRHQAFPPELRQRLMAHSRHGGALLASGSFVGSDLLTAPNDSTPVPAENLRFAREVLGITSSTDENCVGGTVAMIPGRIPGFYANNFDFQTYPDEKHYGVTTPDALYPTDERDVVMRYYDCGLPAAVATEIKPAEGAAISRSLVIGFPIEAVTDPVEREVMIRAALKFLLGKQ